MDPRSMRIKDSANKPSQFPVPMSTSPHSHVESYLLETFYRRLNRVNETSVATAMREAYNVTYMIFQTNGSHIVDTLIMLAELVRFEQKCGAHFPITEPIYNCPSCGAMFEVRLTGDRPDPQKWKKTWREGRTSNHMLDQIGVWRFPALLPFDDHHDAGPSLREGI